MIRLIFMSLGAVNRFLCTCQREFVLLSRLVMSPSFLLFCLHFQFFPQRFDASVERCLGTFKINMTCMIKRILILVSLELKSSAEYNTAF